MFGGHKLSLQVHFLSRKKSPVIIFRERSEVEKNEIRKTREPGSFSKERERKIWCQCVETRILFRPKKDSFFHAKWTFCLNIERPRRQWFARNNVPKLACESSIGPGFNSQNSQNIFILDAAEIVRTVDCGFIMLINPSSTTRWFHRADTHHLTSSLSIYCNLKTFSLFLSLLARSCLHLTRPLDHRVYHRVAARRPCKQTRFIWALSTKR